MVLIQLDSNVVIDERDFLEWVSDPSRTNDELFTVEILLERVRQHNWPFSHVDPSFEGHSERARERLLNPAHRPALHRDELRALQERAATLKFFSGAWGTDRPLRDLQALRFFPELENLSVQSSDVVDLTPLASLQKIQRFDISEYHDLYGCQPLCLAQCGEMPALTHLRLALRHPWPDLRALANWPLLQEINFNGNVLAVEGVGMLSAARVVALKAWVGAAVPLRNLRLLPAMPQVKQLTLQSTASLEGIERYPSVVNLDVDGCFLDLTPLSVMDKMTALTLKGDRFQDLRPLTKIPKLREIKFDREWPLDLSPLADCPQLRRVEFTKCAMMRTEVAALNAGLLPEAADFEAEEPRSLPPLKYYRLQKGDKAGSDFFFQRQRELEKQRDEFYDGDAAFRAAEMRTHLQAVQTKFDELLGRGWGLCNSNYFIPLKRFADTCRLRELIDTLREISARSRFPVFFSFIVEPHGDMTEDLEDIKARDEEGSAPDGDYLAKYYDPDFVLQENEESRQRREERYELLQREHRLRLRDEEQLDPALLYLPKEAEPVKEPEVDESDSISSSSDDEGEGGVALAPPPPPPPNEGENLSDQLMFYLDVYEDCVVANSNWADRAQYHLGVPFVTMNGVS